VENVPVSFIPKSPAALADIEKKACIKEKSIQKAKYIKLIARRNLNQHTAHVILTFKSRESTNHAIKFRLSVASKKVYRCKLLPKPSRCLKCHSYDGGHMATECPTAVDTCGTCRDQHCMATCSITDQNSFYCANCKVKGHTAWSRECPTFLGKWEAHKKRNGESMYRYYPTEDPLMWEKVNEPIDELTEPQTENNIPYIPRPNLRPLPLPPRPNRPDGPRLTNYRTTHQPQSRFPNLNTIPLGSQLRLTDMWTHNNERLDPNTDNQATRPIQQPQQNQDDNLSKDSFFSTLDYNMDSNTASGWD
jgi:hypothetical protein